MAKFCGKVGYVMTIETAPGVSEEMAITRTYKGDLIRNLRRVQDGDKVNSDITVSNEISIVADPFAYENFHSIRYVEFMNSKWTVTSIDVQYPRLNLSLGGVYNGPAENRVADGS